MCFCLVFCPGQVFVLLVELFRVVGYEPVLLRNKIGKIGLAAARAAADPEDVFEVGPQYGVVNFYNEAQRSAAYSTVASKNPGCCKRWVALLAGHRYQLCCATTRPPLTT